MEKIEVPELKKSIPKVFSQYYNIKGSEKRFYGYGEKR